MMRSHSSRPDLRNAGLMFIGAGLMMLGIISGILLIDSQGKDGTAEAADGYQPGYNSVVPVEVNFSAPELNLNDLMGNEVSLEDLVGKVILINNWATWCPPCKEEMPALEAFYRVNVDKGFVLIAINAGDPQADVADFVDRYGLTFPVWLDPTNRALQAFTNYGLPNSYVIDKDGVVRLAWTGAISEQMLDKYVTPLFEE